MTPRVAKATPLKTSAAPAGATTRLQHVAEPERVRAKERVASVLLPLPICWPASCSTSMPFSLTKPPSGAPRGPAPASTGPRWCGRTCERSSTSSVLAHESHEERESRERRSRCCSELRASTCCRENASPAGMRDAAQINEQENRTWATAADPNRDKFACKPSVSCGTRQRLSLRSNGEPPMERAHAPAAVPKAVSMRLRAPI